MILAVCEWESERQGKLVHYACGRVYTTLRTQDTGTERVDRSHLRTTTSSCKHWKVLIIENVDRKDQTKWRCGKLVTREIILIWWVCVSIARSSSTTYRPATKGRCGRRAPVPRKQHEQVPWRRRAPHIAGWLYSRGWRSIPPPRLCTLGRPLERRK